MSLFPYLQLQPIDPQDDGTISDLDRYEVDDNFDLDNDPDGETLIQEWTEITQAMRAEK